MERKYLLVRGNLKKKDRATRYSGIIHQYLTSKVHGSDGTPSMHLPERSISQHR